MSIITEALKKAEHERELKAKQGFQEIGSDGVADEIKPVEVFLEQSAVVEAEIENSLSESVMSQEPLPQTVMLSTSQVRDLSILAGVGAICIVALLLLPRWPILGKNFSILWNPFQTTSKWQAGSGPSISRMISSSLGSSSVSSAGPILPFHLSGISIQGNDRVALVNGIIVQKDDWVDGAHVKEILDREVVLETKTGEIKLKISS